MNSIEKTTGSYDQLKKITDKISGPWLEVNLDAIQHNINQIKKRAQGQELMPVVKANGYGHGVATIGLHLEKMGIWGLCVGKLGEALQLRDRGVTCPVLSLGLFSLYEAREALAKDISLTLTHELLLEELNSLAASCGQNITLHVKIDTGLGRVGISFAEANSVLRRIALLENVVIGGIFTALSEDPGFDNLQIARFEAVCNEAEHDNIPLGKRHVCSSASILGSSRPLFDLVRPGIMVFGYYPSKWESQERKIDLQPAISLKARIAQVKQIEKGQGIAYHHTYRARENETILTGSIGYSDGFPVSACNSCSVLVAGQRLPLVASITANHIYLKCATDMVRKPFNVGDEIVLIGRQQGANITLEELVEGTGFSEYQLLSQLSPLLPRYYFYKAKLQQSS